MFSIDKDNRIHVTRGDVGSINVSAKTASGEDYVFLVGDVVRLQVMKKRECGTVVSKKSVVVEEETTKVTINLSSNDTRIGDVISNSVVYWYEIELNPDTRPQTIIGYDDKGAKEFILYPEGVDVDG